MGLFDYTPKALLEVEEDAVLREELSDVHDVLFLMSNLVSSKAHWAMFVFLTKEMV